MRPRRTRSLVALLDNVRLVGVLALLVGTVAVVISYSAQNGLPLAGTYRISVDVHDAAKLTAHADVRIGGARVGQVLRIAPEPGGGGRRPFARLQLGLDKSVRELPADTTTEVRLASVLGGKYLALVPGRSARGVDDHGRLPLAQNTPSIDQDEALRIFRPRSRTAIQRLLGVLGEATAGRGADLNRSVEHLANALPHAEATLATLIAPGTGLPAFVTAAARLATALQPVAPQLRGLLTGAARTVGAVDRAGADLERSLTALPPTEDRITTALRGIRPALEDARGIARAFTPATRELRPAARELRATVHLAAPIAADAGRLARPLDQALRAVDSFGRSATSRKALKALGANDLATFGGSAFIGLGAILQTASQGQLHCTTLSRWVRNLSSTASEGDSGGNWLRMLPVLGTTQMDHAAAPAPDLHVNFYPHENAAECESGNEPYLPGRQIGNPAGQQAAGTGPGGTP